MNKPSTLRRLCFIEITSSTMNKFIQTPQIPSCSQWHYTFVPMPWKQLPIYGWKSSCDYCATSVDFSRFLLFHHWAPTWYFVCGPIMSTSKSANRYCPQDHTMKCLIWTLIPNHKSHQFKLHIQSSKTRLKRKCKWRC